MGVLINDENERKKCQEKLFYIKNTYYLCG